MFPPTALYPEHSASPCKTVKAAAYADDLTAFMRSATHLPAFQTLVKIYRDGSLARLSWPKTYGLAIGASRRDPHSAHTTAAAMAAGITLDPATVIRLLGIYLGPANQVAAIWNTKTKTVQRVMDKFALWTQKYLPSSIEGKNTVIKNSVLACVWYIIEH